MNQSEYEQLTISTQSLRSQMQFLWRVKEANLAEMDSLLMRNWTLKTEESVLYHAKQISIAFADMKALQIKIDNVGSRIQRIRENN